MDFVLTRILEGGLAPGERLPTERDLASHLGVSRAAVREALTVLMTEGRVVREVGRGTFVAEVPGTGAANIARGPASSPARIVEARIALEPQLAELAVLNATQADLEAVASVCDALSHVDSAAAFEAQDESFHRAIALATQNSLLVQLYDCLAAARRDPDWQKIKENRFRDRPERRPLVLAEHRKIVDRLYARDPEGAREAMTAHLQNVRTNLTG